MIRLSNAQLATVRAYLNEPELRSCKIEAMIRVRKMPNGIYEASCADRKGASDFSAQAAVNQMIAVMEDEG